MSVILEVLRAAEGAPRTSRTCRLASIAQWREHLPCKQGVGGSNPPRGFLILKRLKKTNRIILNTEVYGHNRKQGVEILPEVSQARAKAKMSHRARSLHRFKIHGKNKKI